MKLTLKKQVRIVKKKQCGLSSAFIAGQFGLSKRRIEQVWKYYSEHNSYMPVGRQGRKPYRQYGCSLNDKILNFGRKYRFGATYIAKLLRG